MRIGTYFAFGVWTMAVVSMFWRGITKFYLTRLLGVARKIGFIEAGVWVLMGILAAIQTILSIIFKPVPDEIETTGFILLTCWTLPFITLGITSQIQLNHARCAHEELRNELFDTIRIGDKPDAERRPPAT